MINVAWLATARLPSRADDALTDVSGVSASGDFSDKYSRIHVFSNRLLYQDSYLMLLQKDEQ
jgi:hypothetical protein